MPKGSKSNEIYYQFNHIETSYQLWIYGLNCNDGLKSCFAENTEGLVVTNTKVQELTSQLTSKIFQISIYWQP
jgi:hypothetical protein